MTRGPVWTRAALLGAALACACAESATPGQDDASLPDSGARDVAVDRGADGPIDAPFDGDAGSCVDGLRNGKESDVDCGGNCGACGDGKDCLADADCQVGTCFAGKCAPRAWMVESTGSNVAVPGNQTWIPANLTLSPTLVAPSLVSLRWTGTLRFGGGGNGLCHVGHRFVVDGAPTGNPSWGDGIMVQNGATRPHEAFNDSIALPLSAGIHTVSVEMLNAQGFGTCYLDGDGGLAYDRSRLAIAAYDPQRAWYAESNADTGFLAGPSPWTDIPGASVSFNLTGTDHVQTSLAGTQLAQGAGSAHCSYRFVVDGAPLGHPTYGQTIAVGDVASGWWAPVALAYGADLAAGSHVISAQVSNSSGSGTCNAGQGNNGYARFRMLVTASASGSPATSVESSGGPDVLGSGSPWTTIGGLTASFNVPARRHLQLELAATERTMSGSGHCAWRFLVDGAPLGHPDHGMGINVGDGATWWTTTPLLWGQTFEAGSHTVSAQVRNSSSSGDCGANADAQLYGRSRLLVRAP